MTATVTNLQSWALRRRIKRAAESLKSVVKTLPLKTTKYESACADCGRELTLSMTVAILKTSAGKAVVCRACAVIRGT